MTTIFSLYPDLENALGSTVTDLIQKLVEQIDAKTRRNRLRSDYYDMHNAFRDLGVAIPPHLRNLDVAMGWPAKAVDTLSRRVWLEGFTVPGGEVDKFGINEMWNDNRMVSEAPQAHTSSLIHSTSFIMTTLGDMSLGEPEVMMSVHNAFDATGVWDPSRRGLSSALVVMSRDDYGVPTRILFLTPVAVADIRYENDRWRVRSARHDLGRVPVEPLVYRARLGRPFGSSRISHDVMSLTDAAMRTLVRAEVGAEFYSAPQRYILGADEEMFVGPDGEKKSVWDLVMGRILAVPAWNPEEDPEPKVDQFPQISMQPHSDQMRMWAQRFSDSTGVPLSALGQVGDNPTSAEALYAQERELIIEAKATQNNFEPAWIRSVVTGVQLREGLNVPPAELRGLGVQWADPSLPSQAAATDSVIKQVQAGVLPVDSAVTLEQLGYDTKTIDRIVADRRRSSGRAALTALQSAASRVNDVGVTG